MQSGAKHSLYPWLFCLVLSVHAMQGIPLSSGQEGRPRIHPTPFLLTISVSLFTSELTNEIPA